MIQNFRNYIIHKVENVFNKIVCFFWLVSFLYVPAKLFFRTRKLHFFVVTFFIINNFSNISTFVHFDLQLEIFSFLEFLFLEISKMKKWAHEMYKNNIVFRFEKHDMCFSKKCFCVMIKIKKCKHLVRNCCCIFERCCFLYEKKKQQRFFSFAII